MVIKIEQKIVEAEKFAKLEVILGEYYEKIYPNPLHNDWHFKSYNAPTHVLRPHQKSKITGYEIYAREAKDSANLVMIGDDKDIVMIDEENVEIGASILYGYLIDKSLEYNQVRPYLLPGQGRKGLDYTMELIESGGVGTLVGVLSYFCSYTVGLDSGTSIGLSLFSGFVSTIIYPLIRHVNGKNPNRIITEIYSQNRSAHKAYLDYMATKAGNLYMGIYDVIERMESMEFQEPKKKDLQYIS